jgi:signal transduction histidine kinase
MMQRDLLDYRPVNLNLHNKVDKIIGISIHSALKKHVSISNRVDPGIFVYADAEMLRSVVQNLIINAIKFTQPEGRIIVSAIEKDDCIEVSVQDSGIGIEAEKFSKLFDFNTIFTTLGTDGEKGTGLGLPLCKEFIERNDGKIWVESEVGKGSKFMFTLRKAIL